MSYKVEVRTNCRAYPVVVCDHCGEQITQAGGGNALWLEDGGPGTTYEVRHAHDRCTDAFERAHPAGTAGHWMFNELDHHFFMLLLNCRYDEQTAKRKTLALSMLD